MPMSAEKLVYKVADGYVTVQGVGKIAVSSFMLIIQHNGIPTLRLNIVPRLYMPAKPSQDGYANIASLTDFIQAYDRLSQAAEDADKRVSSFYFKAISTGGDTQTLDLKDWLLTSVGYGGLSASGAMQLSLELCHPIKKINECAINFFGMVSQSTEYTADKLEGLANLHAGLVKVLELYHASAVRANNARNANAYTLMLARFVAAKDAFNKHLAWEGSVGWPWALFSQIKTAIPKALWAYVWSISSTTLWDWLTGMILSDWFVSIRPTYWKDALTLEPSEPWRESRLSISSDDISDISLPPADPQNLSGAVARASNNLCSVYSSWNNPSVYADGTSGGACWVEPLSVGGALLPFELPGWYYNALHIFGAEQAGSFQSNTPANANTASATTAGVSATLLSFLPANLQSFAQEYFVQSYRRGFEISVTTRLLIQYGGARPHAGYVHSLVTPDGGTLLSYFATRVIHVVDCVAKQAYTQITGAYIRRASGPTLKAIPGGQVGNTLYGPSGPGGGAVATASARAAAHQNTVSATVMGPNGPVTIGGSSGAGGGGGGGGSGGGSGGSGGSATGGGSGGGSGGAG